MASRLGHIEATIWCLARSASACISVTLHGKNAQHEAASSWERRLHDHRPQKHRVDTSNQFWGCEQISNFEYLRVKLTWWQTFSRLGSWFSKGWSLSSPGRRYLYSRRSSLETFSRNASPPIRPYQLQEPKYFWRTCQWFIDESSRINWCGWSPTTFLPVHSCHHHCTHLWRTCWWSWRWRSQHLRQLVWLCIEDQRHTTASCRFALAVYTHRIHQSVWQYQKICHPLCQQSAKSQRWRLQQPVFRRDCSDSRSLSRAQRPSSSARSAHSRFDCRKRYYGMHHVMGIVSNCYVNGFDRFFTNNSQLPSRPTSQGSGTVAFRDQINGVKRREIDEITYSTNVIPQKCAQRK